MDAAKSEIRDNMQIDWDTPIRMDDGVVLRADVYRPVGKGKFPVILSYGPYAKGLSFQEGYKSQWSRVTKSAPEVLQGSSNKYQNWELVDPEKWVPDGYALVRVDSRGAGRSLGTLDVWSEREAQDLYECVEWAGTQTWSNGKVGINGISYYAMNQWNVGALKPPHLAALCIWEGSSDYYRELARHGGILCDFLNSWHPRQVASVQHGVGTRGAKSAVTGEPVAGPETLPKKNLPRNAPTRRAKRSATGCATIITPRAPPMSPRSRRPCFRRPIGAARACTRAEISKAGCAPAPNRNGWRCTAIRTSRISTAITAKLCRNASSVISSRARTPAGASSRASSLNIRHPGEKFVLRAENEWPLARTQWTKYFLQPDGQSLGTDTPTAATMLSYENTGDGLTFRTPPSSKSLEITGPVAAKLWVSSETTDADLFLVLRLFDPAGNGGHVHRLQRPAHAGRTGLVARLASQARSQPCRGRTGPGTRTMKNGRLSPASRSSSISKSGRPRSWCRPAIGSRSRCGARITKWTAATRRCPMPPTR